MRRSMSRPLPELADPIRLCAGESEFSGTLALADFDRLCQNLASDAGEVSFTVKFGRDARGINAVRGTIDTTLNLLCERCTQPFDLPVHADWQLGAVSSLAEADQLPEEYEPLLVGEELTRLRDVLEDELLLALPLVPRHPESDNCQPVTGGSEEQEPGRDSPFAVLKELRNRDKDSGE